MIFLVFNISKTLLILVKIHFSHSFIFWNVNRNLESNGRYWTPYFGFWEVLLYKLVNKYGYTIISTVTGRMLFLYITNVV
jgi:hypothetical protein